MSGLREVVNQSYTSVLSLVPKDKWANPEVPVAVMDSRTHQLIQIDDLYRAIDFTKTSTGGLVLRRSVNHPLTDACLITEKQRSLSELRADPSMRSRIVGIVEAAAKDEDLLYSHYRGDYSTFWIGRPNIYDATKGSARLLGCLAENIKGVRAQTDYLNSLLDNITKLREDDVFNFIKGPVYQTSEGLKQKKDIRLNPRLRYYRTDWKPVRLLMQAAPILPTMVALLSESRELAVLAVYLGMGCVVWFPTATNLGRGFDNRVYGKPLAEMYFGSPQVVNAIESLGKMDELLSLTEYAESIQGTVSLPRVEDVPSHYFEARDLRNPVLVKDNPDYVGNDVSLCGSRLTFLTGPNSGGKTSLSKTILQTQILAQIGSYIPAEQARISVADGIYYHCPMVNNLQDKEGRFGVEIARTRDIFFKTTPKTLVVLDELIEATTYSEKIKHSRSIMDGFFAIGGNTILVTHNHELAEYFRQRGRGQFWQVEFDGEKATHKVIPGISQDSHADKVMERLGFSDDDIQKYLAEKGYTLFSAP